MRKFNFAVVFGFLFALSCGSLCAGSLMDLVPGESGIIFRADLDKLVKLAGPEAGKANQEAAKNLMSEGNEAVTFFMASKEGGWEAPSAGLLMTGKFDAKLLSEKLESMGKGKSAKFKNYAGFMFDSNPKTMLIFLDKETVAFGRKAEIDSILEAKDNPKKSLGQQASWSGLLKNSDKNSAWMGSIFSAAMKEHFKTIPLFASLDVIENMEVIGTADQKEAQISGNVITIDEAAGQKCGDLLNNMITALKGIAGQGTPQAAILNSASVSAAGNVVKFELKWPRGQLPQVSGLMNDFVKQATEEKK